MPTQKARFSSINCHNAKNICTKKRLHFQSMHNIDSDNRVANWALRWNGDLKAGSISSLHRLTLPFRRSVPVPYPVPRPAIFASLPLTIAEATIISRRVDFSPKRFRNRLIGSNQPLSIQLNLLDGSTQGTARTWPQSSN